LLTIKVADKTIAHIINIFFIILIFIVTKIKGLR